MKKYNYILGLDVGISSVGWGLLELKDDDKPYKILDTGVRIFTPGEVAKTGASKALERREKRGARRIIQRREYRLDRVRLLLSDYSFLPKYPCDMLPSDREEYLTEVYNQVIQQYYKNKNVNPYQLKVKALSEKLSNEELAIILVHYAKHRGYKSNREENNSDKESGKIKQAISENSKIMEEQHYMTVSEMFVKDFKFKDRIRNSEDNYKMSVSREMYESEINKVLDAQIKFGLIDDKFKEAYLEIWKSQRHYSKGPGYLFYKENGILKKKISPYGDEKSLIAKMTGTCKFDDLPRAPKCAPSAEVFVLLERLLNLRYKTTGQYTALLKEEIKEIIDLAKTKDKVTYKDIAKVLNQKEIVFKDNSLSKKDYTSCLSKLKEQFNKDSISYNDLSLEEKTIYKQAINAKKLENTFGSLKTYNVFRKTFSKWNAEVWNKIKDDFPLLDEIATILTDCKLNEDIKREIEKSDKIANDYYEIIIELPNLKDHLMLSLNIIYQLIPLMQDGMRYDLAMKSLDKVHYDTDENIVKTSLLPPVNQKKEISNQRVLRSLSQSRKVINAIIKKYGLPKEIKIETARELAKSREERNKIEKDQKERYESNITDKKYLVEILPTVFKSIDYVSSTDLLKYKLWKEQGERCSYSLEKIALEDVFDKNKVQIDHILPYSRTFDDSYFNKTLVLTKYNQEKKEMTPYEWFGKTERWTSFKNYISLLNISDKKKDHYLLEDLTEEIASDMRNQNLNDTKYISKYLTNFIKAYLNVEKVSSYSGSITGKLRGRWGLNGLTHSLESSNYRVKLDNYDELTKNRENHLHHAMDALVIASITKSLQDKIIAYEKFYRYLNNKTSSQLQEFMNKNEYYINSFVDDETGEVTRLSIRNYIDEGLKTGQLKTNKHNPTYYLTYPQPYENFAKEAIYRVYERDPQILKEKLANEIRTYSKEDLDKVRPIYPSFAKQKLSGPLHEETIGGYQQEANVLTNRVSIIKESFNLDKLNSLLDKDTGAKVVFETLKEWLADCKNGKEAYDKKGFPINPKTGNLIKKVKLEKEYKGKGHFINNGFVERKLVYRTDIYKKVDDDRLYFVGYDLFDLAQIKNKKDFDLTLWYGQGNAKKSLKYSDLSYQYQFYESLAKNQLVSITKDDDSTALAYIVGFSRGQLEIKGLIGDERDLYAGNNMLFKKKKKNGRYMPTVSTIKSIKKLNISVLGDIYGL